MHERIEQRRDTGGRERQPAPPRGAALPSAIGNRALGRLIAGTARKRELAREINDYMPRRIKEGCWKLMLSNAKEGAKVGLRGTIEFYPGATAPDSTEIKLFQTARMTDKAGKPVKRSGDEKQRNDVMTKADKKHDVEAGWFVDNHYKDLRPRKKASDAPVSPYYSGRMTPGSKAGTARTKASLQDFPGIDANDVTFEFETVAKATDTNHVYGSVRWGFTILNGKVTGEHHEVSDTVLPSTAEALRRYDVYFKNPGSPNEPKK